MKAFSECVGGRKFQGAVEESARNGSGMGVDATPTFFVNGRFLAGAQPFEVFQAIIDEELKKK